MEHPGALEMRGRAEHLRVPDEHQRRGPDPIDGARNEEGVMIVDSTARSTPPPRAKTAQSTFVPSSSLIFPPALLYFTTPSPSLPSFSHTSASPTNTTTNNTVNTSTTPRHTTPHPTRSTTTRSSPKLSPQPIGANPPPAYHAASLSPVQSSSSNCPPELLSLPAIPATTRRLNASPPRYTLNATYGSSTADNGATNMQFASSKTPTLTPLGQRLLALSRAKLYALDIPAGARDPADGLRRGVLVREAIRSAWASLETPTAHSELTSWRAPSLDVLTEEDEDEYDDAAEAQWLDDVLADVDQDMDLPEAHPVADYTVGAPVYDDFDDEFEATESYTISSYADTTGVSIVAVSDDDEDDDMVDAWLEESRAPHHVAYDLELAEELEVVAEPTVPTKVDSTSITLASPGTDPKNTILSASSDGEVDELLVTPPESPDGIPDLAYALAALSTYALPPEDTFRRPETKPLPTVDEPIRPRFSRRAPFASKPNEDEDQAAQPDDEVQDDEHCLCDRLGLACDGECLPPSLCEDAEDDECEECRTPPLQSLDCDALEVVSGLATFDWKAEDRISSKPNQVEEIDFSASALGLRWGV